jgi:hypothetical protein
VLRNTAIGSGIIVTKCYQTNGPFIIVKKSEVIGIGVVAVAKISVYPIRKYTAFRATSSPDPTAKEYSL